MSPPQTLHRYLTTAAFLQYPNILASLGLNTNQGANMMIAALMLGLCTGAVLEQFLAI